MFPFGCLERLHSGFASQQKSQGPCCTSKALPVGTHCPLTSSPVSPELIPVIAMLPPGCSLGPSLAHQGKLAFAQGTAQKALPPMRDPLPRLLQSELNITFSGLPPQTRCSRFLFHFSAKHLAPSDVYFPVYLLSPRPSIRMQSPGECGQGGGYFVLCSPASTQTCTYTQQIFTDELLVK